MFAKKKKGSTKIFLNEDQFCKVLEENAAEVKHSYYISTSDRNYNLLYRDGQFLGMPTPFGGPLYPFSPDPKRMGSKSDKKKFTYAEIVCLSKDFQLKVYWGTPQPFLMRDCITKEPYRVGAKGVFYVSIDKSDAARSADRFYSKCLTQRNAETFNKEQLRDFLAEAFINRVGAKIQESLEALKLPISDLVGLQPAEFVKISEELCKTMSDIFADLGLKLEEKESSGSILDGLYIRPIE